MDTFKIWFCFTDECSDIKNKARNIAESDQTIKKLEEKLSIATRAQDFTDIAPQRGAQDLIDREIIDYEPDWMVFIFSHRIGSPTNNDEKKTGIQHEWQLSNGEIGDISIDAIVSTYFDDSPIDRDELDTEQLENLKEFKEGVSNIDLYYEFESLDDFKDSFKRHLMEFLIEHSPLIPATDERYVQTQEEQEVHEYFLKKDETKAAAFRSALYVLNDKEIGDKFKLAAENLVEVMEWSMKLINVPDNKISGWEELKKYFENIRDRKIDSTYDLFSEKLDKLIENHFLEEIHPGTAGDFDELDQIIEGDE